ncbi:MAG: nuclear transport factor 2 family protein [Clostridia bacterium]|nr:nuclear transport factor 2 family protein [Clostridia bacterium]
MNNMERLNAFFQAENSRDWDVFSEYLHEEVMWFLHGEDAHLPVAGRQEYMERILAGYAETDATFTWEILQESASGNRIVALLRNSRGGRSMNVFDFENGLIRWEHEFTLD